MNSLAYYTLTRAQLHGKGWKLPHMMQQDQVKQKWGFSIYVHVIFRILEEC